MKRLLIAFFVAGLLSILPAAAFAQEAAPAPDKPEIDASQPQTISFHRPWKRGDKYEIDVTLDFYYFQKSGKSIQGRETMPIDALETGEEKFLVNLKGNIRIIKVNEVGQATWRAVKITEAKVTSEGETETLSIEGTDLGVSFQGDKMNFQRKDGEEIPPKEKMFLSMLFTSPSSINKDDYLAPPGPVNVGDTWNGNAEIFAKLMSGDDEEAPAKEGEEEKEPGLTAENIDIKLTLKGIEDWEEIPCYRILEERLIHDLEVPRFTGEYFIEVKNERWMPVDSSVKKSKLVQTYQRKMKGKQVDERTNYIDVWTDMKMTTNIIYR